jgi:hypothetical protein
VPKGLAQYPIVQQSSLFGPGPPDARAIGTLLHTIINYLHASNGLLSAEKQTLLLSKPEMLDRFIRRDLHSLLQRDGKIQLALTLHDLHYDARLLARSLIEPMMRYSRELVDNRAVVFGVAERFQVKLSSTRNTFANFPGRGGYVGLIGEFDQIRLFRGRDGSAPRGVPAIIEFKKSLGWRKKAEDEVSLEGEGELVAHVQPTAFHAMQLMIYWLAFQSLWDTEEFVRNQRGMATELPMQLSQSLDMILYNFYDGSQYRLIPTDNKEALLSLIECVFYLDWSLKSGYSYQSPAHDCQRTAPLTELPEHAIQVQVGETLLPAKECYLLALAAFERFKATITWEQLLHPVQNHE